MGVKTIFKTIMATIIGIFIVSVVLEVFNITTTSLQLGSIAKISTRQACVFFGQETYKREDFKNIDMSDLYGSDGTNCISGTFYTGGSAEGIYKNLYGEGSKFLNSSGPVKTILKGNWESLDLLINRNDAWGMGEWYREALMTPLNLGIPYLDKDVVERIMKWNLTSILNNGQVDGYNLMNMHRDSSNRIYVIYKGFRVYVNEAQITDIQYKVLDLTTSQGRSDFKEYTNMDASVITSTTDGNSDERNKVCLAGISYTVPMSYEGITPIKKIMEFAWNQQVAGANNNTNAGQSRGNVWNDKSESAIQQGGFDGGAPTTKGVLPVPGELIYYIVR